MISFFPFIHHSLALQVNGYKAGVSEVTAFLHLYATTIKCLSTSFPSLLSPGLELKKVRAGMSLADSTRVCLLARVTSMGRNLVSHLTVSCLQFILAEKCIFMYIPRRLCLLVVFQEMCRCKKGCYGGTFPVPVPSWLLTAHVCFTLF